MKKGHGLTTHSKSDMNFGKNGVNIARRWSDATYGSIEMERLKALNPPKKESGLRMRIINYINFMKMGGFNVTDEEIINYIKKKMPKIDESDIERIIDDIRQKERDKNDGR